MNTKKLKQKLLKKEKPELLTSKDFVSTGSTLLNLACTDRPFRGFAKGMFYGVVGDSNSGKTFLTLTCLAEASINPNFDDFRFIYDNGENGALMNIAKFFGESVEERLEPPSRDKLRNPVYSSTIEEFYYHLDDAVETGKPFIYILDSMDSLSSEDEFSKFKEQKKAYIKGTETSGSYGDGKAKKNSAGIRRMLHFLRKTGSILIVIGQTRDNLGFGFNKKIRSGGHALEFYAGLELWSSKIGQITKTVMGKKRQLGIECQIRVKKNRVSGKDRTIVIPIYHSYGIDDIGSCIDYLLSEGTWTDTKGIINAKDFSFKGSKEKLISHIEKMGLIKELREIVGETWRGIEKACELNRMKRY